MSEAARSHRPDLRVEPTMEASVARRPDAGSPLSELAQLVGQHDPFRDMFRQAKPAARQAVTPAAEIPMPANGHASHDQVAAAHDTPIDDYNPRPDEHQLGLRPSVHDQETWPETEADAAHWHQGPDEPAAYPASQHGDAQGHVQYDHEPEGAYAEPQAHADHQAYADPHQDHSHMPAYDAPPMTPDLWAGHGESERPSASAARSDEGLGSHSPRKPLIVLMAVLALTGGGLAATFLARSGSASVATSSGSAPTILAATGPTKIKQADGAGDSTPEDANAALLNKKGLSGTGPVKVVNSQEQPIDLAQLPKAAAAPDASNASSPFPTPKKVKTFLVRPDGSLVGSPPASRAAVPSLAVAADGATDSIAPPAARASTPKSVSNAATTPKAPQTSIADIAAGDATNNQQAATRGADTPVGKPVELASASTDTTASTGPSGSFALQLAASPSEQDARTAFTRLQRKHSELAAYQPTVKKVDNGQKTMYRLRVSNLGQNEAKTLCSKLQASGGSCFVVHN